MYLGGKTKLANQIAEVIKLHAGGGYNEYLISLFCGGCPVESQLGWFKNIICNDKHYYLIEMFKAIQNGYKLPDRISEQQYEYIRSHKDEDKALTGFVGFACSFSGKWFGGYAKSYKENRNYCKEGKASIEKYMETLKTATFTCQDYREVNLPTGCVIYADPPYENTTGYGNEKFDNVAFWEYARKVSKNHLMYISEQNAPDDFIPIWQTPFTRTVNYNKEKCGRPIVTEKLFVHKSNVGNFVPQFGEQQSLF